MEMISFTRDFFGSDSPLKAAPQAGGQPYEQRPQQQAMACAVAEHLQQGTTLCVEAPTGIGKTFAYLVPAILHAIRKEAPVVVSTHTISLQEQILEKDVPVLTQLLDQPFEAAVAKGRSNYACLRRLQALGEIDRDQMPDQGMLNELGRIWQWVGHTDNGSRSDLDFEPSRQLWELICCEAGNCLNQRCPHRQQCFLLRARRNLAKAQIIVANHALFFSDLALRLGDRDGDAAILPTYAGVVMDEAHTIEDCAADHLGVQAGSFALRRLLRRLYERDRDRGLLRDGPWAEARDAVTKAADAAELFFRRVVEWLEPQAKDPLRYTVPGHVPNYVGPRLNRAVHHVEKLAVALSAEGDDPGLATELTGICEQLRSLDDAMDLFLEMKRADHVYWFERRGRERQEVVFNAVPVAVGPLLQSSLFQPGLPVILTSATLAVRGALDYFQGRIGALNAEALILDTPFDFERQVTLYVPQAMPSPKDASRFVPAAADKIRDYIRRSQGRAFVLFTSYAMMHDTAEELADFFEQEGLQLLVQGDGMPRNRMLETFREDVSSVIFGTASFWTGVDVPGEALSNVIIVRLPFSVPDHPLVASRQEDIERRGGRAFSDYALPEAILRFRQGFGRLIRSRNDTGMVVILDNRVITTSYGKAFLASIPKCTVIIE